MIKNLEELMTQKTASPTRYRIQRSERDDAIMNKSKQVTL